MKLTEWFPCKVNPVRRGWYEVSCHYGVFGDGERLYWDGRMWIHNGEANFGHRCDQWRGLAEKP